MKKNLVADIGNTHIVIGVYHDDKILHSFRMKTDTLKTEDEYYNLLLGLMQIHGLNINEITNFALSSVVPSLARTFNHLVEKYLKCRIINVNGYLDLGLKYPMKDPGLIGADLVVNAFAAKEIYNLPTIVCDFGTATTIQLVGSDGYFFGTVIVPGVMTSASKLFSVASKLSNIQLESPKELLGTNTVDALRSGIISGNRFMLDGFIKEIRKKYSYLGEIKAVATGGIAEMICKDSNEIDVVNKTLTLDGLNIICNK
jgi:type III pantothenate kinase